MPEAVEFQATAQPMLQPWPEPAVSRLMNSMPPCSRLALSTSSPVAQRWCGWMGGLIPLTPKFSTTVGPGTALWVIMAKDRLDPREALRWINTCDASMLKSAGLAG